MSSGPPSTEQGLAALARGATIGRYVILGLVGRGGMGEVYAAYDPELDRKVAVKLLRAKPGHGLSMAEGRQRTLREAQAIARLSHPNVVVVYDVGTFRDQVFIAMEFVEGNTVTYWVESQARSWQEVLRVFMAAGRGLMAAHEKGLVHRDFKPDNVMVGKDSQVRVMDFGLARQVNDRAQTPEGGTSSPSQLRLATVAPAGGAEAGATVAAGSTVAAAGVERAPPETVDPMATIVLNTALADETGASGRGGTGPGAAMFDVQLTRTGAMMGTPAYMAPEQFLGMPTNARTDQFSFCIALYEALYHERPFAGSTMFALTSNVVQGNVREPPAASRVPLWVRKVLLRGLRPQAAERFPSMTELIEALGSNPSITRRKWAIAGAVVATVVGLGVAGKASLDKNRTVCTGGPEKLGGIWELRPAAGGESPRQAQIHAAFLRSGKGYAAEVYATVATALSAYADGWAKMHRDACVASQIRGEQSLEVMDLRMNCLDERLGRLRALTDVFTSASGEVVENAVSAVNALGSLDRCADVPLLRAIVRPPEDPTTRARVAKLHDRLAAVKASFDAGHLRQAIKDAPPVVDDARAVGYKPVLAEALALAGNVSAKASDTVNARRYFTEAMLVADASHHDELRADVAAYLVFLGYQEGQFEEAKRWYETAEAVLERLGGHDLLRAWLLNNMGLVYNDHGYKEEALRAHLQAVALKEKALGPDHPDVGVSEGNVAVVLADSGRDQDALTYVDRSIVLLENGLGAAHPDLAIQLSNRGEILNALGRYQDARQSFERARVIWERELGLENRNLGYALTGIGISFLGEGNPAGGLAALERARKIREKQETDPAKRAETSFALARALWEANHDHDRSRARELAEEARIGYGKAAQKGKQRAEVEGWLDRHRAG
jgi:serine/threonine protein kinase/tetratricopeptide (TPR) repeat protein